MVILWNGTLVAMFANDEDTDRCRATSKSVSSIVVVSDIATFVLKRDVKLQLTN